MLIPTNCGRVSQWWRLPRAHLTATVIPAKAGIRWRWSVGSFQNRHGEWIPAFAGMTMVFSGATAPTPIRSL